MPERGTIPFFADDLCHIGPFAFKRLLSIATATIEWLSSTITISSKTNRHSIVDILCLISVEIVFNRLSNVRLLLGIVTRPQTNDSLMIY